MKVDIVYYKTNTDFEMEFNLCGCCRMRLLNSKVSDRKDLILSLTRAVSRSKIIIVAGNLFGEDNIIENIAGAIGKEVTVADNQKYGIKSEEQINIISGSVPLVNSDGYFGGCIIESGTQVMILVSESKSIRKSVMESLIHPYITQLYTSANNTADSDKTNETAAPAAEPQADAVDNPTDAASEAAPEAQPTAGQGNAAAEILTGAAEVVSQTAQTAAIASAVTAGTAAATAEAATGIAQASAIAEPAVASATAQVPPLAEPALAQPAPVQPAEPDVLPITEPVAAPNAENLNNSSETAAETSENPNGANPVYGGEAAAQYTAAPENTANTVPEIQPATAENSPESMPEAAPEGSAGTESVQNGENEPELFLEAEKIRKGAASSYNEAYSDYPVENSEIITEQTSDFHKKPNFANITIYIILILIAIAIAALIYCLITSQAEANTGVIDYIKNIFNTLFG